MSWSHAINHILNHGDQPQTIIANKIHLCFPPKVTSHHLNI